MRKTYRNALAKLIAESELSLTDFTTSEKDGLYTVSRTNNSSIHFSIKVNGNAELDTAFNPLANALSRLNGLFSVEMSPGEVASTGYNQFHEWEALLNSFSLWLEWVQEEINTPDLWAEAAKTAQLFAPTTEPSDDKFTRTELAEVQGQLRLLQLSFTQAALPEAAKQKLIELTQAAAVKAEGLTKKDWQNWIIGGFISAITGLALNPTQAGEVLKLVKAAFGGLFLH